MIGHPNTIDIEDHPAARAVLEGRQPDHRVAVLLVWLQVAGRICCCEILAPVLALASPSCGCSSRKAGEPLRG